MALAFLFGGQGAQKVGMGRSLYENSAAARSVYEAANRVLGWNLSATSFEGPQEALTETKVCQPALFVHGMAVLEALRERGRLPSGEPACALGLSLGELTAYCAAGVFDFTSGLRIVAERGRLMQRACETTAGAMAAIIGEERSRVEELCRDMLVETANYNAPGQIIISGERARIDAAVATARERGMRKVIPLNVAGAYHSRLMEPARAAFATYLEPIQFAAPKFKMITNTTGQAIGDPVEIKAALVKQIVSPVRWEYCMRTAAAAGVAEMWELGPGGVLAGLARRTDKSWCVKSFSEFGEISA